MKNGTGCKTIICMRKLPVLLSILLLAAGFLCALPVASSAAGIGGAEESPAGGGLGDEAGVGAEAEAWVGAEAVPGAEDEAGVGAEVVPGAEDEAGVGAEDEAGAEAVSSAEDEAGAVPGGAPGLGAAQGIGAGTETGPAQGIAPGAETAQGAEAWAVPGGVPGLGAETEVAVEAAAGGDQPQDDQPQGGQTMAAMALVPDGGYDAEYYVSADGSDSTGDGSMENPWATLAKTAGVINWTGVGGDYLIYVMTDLTSTACARYYDNSATILSLGDTPFTVTRGTGFSTQSETRRSWYNPAMLEIGSTILNEDAPEISLTLSNIIFDDAYRHEGTSFDQYAPKSGVASTVFVQDAIVASYAASATIVLDDGAELRNFGGMSAARVTNYASLVMKGGSAITDIRPNTGTNNRAVSSSATNHYANGEAAISLLDASIYMEAGAKITNIANAHGIKLSGTTKCFMDGEISGMIGNKGMDTDPGNGGRGFKNAMMFNGRTLDPETGEPGPAVIGKNGLVVRNATKSGAVAINRNAAAALKIYGKVNNNTGGTGGTLNLQGTNGGGLFVVVAGTIYLEEGSEVCGNSLGGLASYGGAASIQQGSARLVMNGGLVSGNSARTANTQGIVVNKGDASFEMNGGVINNGAHGVHLYESGTNGTLTLNAGRVSGVTVDNNISFGKNTQRRLFLKQGVVIDTGYASVAGRQVWPVSADYHIGNPNFANYGGIMAALPQGWSMPANAGNVIGFWMKKGGTAVFSVPAPTAGAPPDNYDRGLGVYFAAVQGTLDSGAADASSKVRFYPAVLENGRIKVSLPLKAYANGATVVLVQPSEEYGVIEFQGPEMLPYDPKATGYNIYYTATYEMPENLQALLDTDGHSNANTVFNLVIRPDGLTAPDIASLTVSSDLFETGGPAVWDDQAWELTVPLVLKDGWGAATDLVTDFTFTCGMDAGDFFDGGVLSLTGHMVIDGENGAGDKKIYYILGNTVNTEMLIPEVGTDGEETIVETVEGLAGGEGLSAGAAAGDIAITPPPPGTADGGKKAWGVPLTGDKFSLGLWLAGLALGLLGLIGAHMARSKAKQR